MNNLIKNNVFSRFLALYLKHHQRKSNCGLSLFLGDISRVSCSNFSILNYKQRSLVRASMKYPYILLRKSEDTGILTLPWKQCCKQNLPAHKKQSQLPEYDSIQWLCEDICKLILRINWKNRNFLVCYMPSKVMIFDSNMLRSWCEFLGSL